MNDEYTKQFVMELAQKSKHKLLWQMDSRNVINNKFKISVYNFKIIIN